MSTRITVDALSAESLEKAAYRVRKLQRLYANKNREFVQELLKAGIKVINANKAPDRGDSEPPEDVTMPHVMMGNRDGVMTATLRLRGEDVMFIEFGAGISYNTQVGGSMNPLGVQLGYTIGSYGMGQGAHEYWFYEDKDDHETKKSYGTEAMMPMWKADQEIRQKFASIAKQVFSKTNGV